MSTEEHLELLTKAMITLTYEQIEWLFANELHKLIYWREILGGYGREGRLADDTYYNMPIEFQDLANN
jgi:hypothetical protein